MTSKSEIFCIDAFRNSTYDEDYNFDSVSMRSSTIADSELVESQIREYEKENRCVVPIERSGNSINLQISVMNNSK